jgi:hypothetical protein
MARLLRFPRGRLGPRLSQRSPRNVLGQPVSREGRTMALRSFCLAGRTMTVHVVPVAAAGVSRQAMPRLCSRADWMGSAARGRSGRMSTPRRSKGTAP